MNSNLSMNYLFSTFNDLCSCNVGKLNFDTLVTTDLHCTTSLRTDIF